ncbi:MAG: phage tail tape measure protein [Bacteroidota bacterium]
MTESVQFNLLIKDNASNTLTKFAKNAEKNVNKVKNLFGGVEKKLTSTRQKVTTLSKSITHLGGEKQLAFNKQLKVANGHMDRLINKMNRLKTLGAGGNNRRSDAGLVSGVRGGGNGRGVMPSRDLIGSYLTPVATIAAFSSMINAGSQFEKKLVDIRGILEESDKFSEDLFTGLKGKIGQVGTDTIYTMSQVADATKFMAMAGMNIMQIDEALPAVTNIAAVGNLGVEQAADIVTNISTGMGIASSRMIDVADVLTGTFTRTNVNLGELGQSFSYAGNVAAQNGIEFEELAAAIGLLGNAGIKGSRAGTNLRQMIIRMIAPTNSARASMEKYGISFTKMSEDGHRVLKPLRQIVKEIDALDVSADDRKEIFGIFGGTAFGALSTQRTEDGGFLIDKVNNEIRNVKGISDALSKAKMETFSGQVAKMRANFENLSITLFEKVKPGLSIIITTLNNFFQWLNGPGQFVIDGTGKAFLVLGNAIGQAFNYLQRFLTFARDHWKSLRSVAVGAFEVFMILKTFGLISGIIAGVSRAIGILRVAIVGLNAAMRSNPVGLIITAIQVLIVALIYAWNKWEGFRAAVFTVFNLLKLVFKGFGTWIGNVRKLFSAIWNNLLVPLGTWIGGLFQKLVFYGKLVWQSWSMLVHQIGQKLEPLKKALGAFFKGLKVVAAPVFSVFESIGNFFDNIWGKVVGFAKKIAENEWVKAIFGASSFGLIKAIADEFDEKAVGSAIKKGKQQGAEAKTFNLTNLLANPASAAPNYGSGKSGAIRQISSTIEADLGGGDALTLVEKDSVVSEPSSVSGGKNIIIYIGNLLNVESVSTLLEDEKGENVFDMIANGLIETVRDTELGLSN